MSPPRKTRAARGGPKLPPVVIPASPDSQHLATAIAAVLAGGTPRVYVVSERGSFTEETVVSIPTPADAGFAARANLGLEAAEQDGFELALLLNDDTELLGSGLTALADSLNEPRVAVAGAVLVEWTDGAVQQSGIAVSERTGRVRMLRDVPVGKETDRDAVSGAALALRLDTWRELGGFCELFTYYFEDIDFCLRARKAGYRVVICPEARVRHREGGTLNRRSPEVAWHLGRGQTLLARRLGGSFAARQARLASSVVLGLSWTTRELGPGALPDFAEGALTALRCSSQNSRAG